MFIGVEGGRLPRWLGYPGRYGYFRSIAVGQASDMKSAADEGGTLAHSQQPHGLRVQDLGTGDAATVVPHFQSNSTLGFPQMDVPARGTGVPDDVSKGLLEYAKEGGA